MCSPFREYLHFSGWNVTLSRGREVLDGPCPTLPSEHKCPSIYIYMEKKAIFRQKI